MGESEKSHSVTSTPFLHESWGKRIVYFIDTCNTFFASVKCINIWIIQIILLLLSNVIYEFLFFNRCGPLHHIKWIFELKMHWHLGQRTVKAKVGVYRHIKFSRFSWEKRPRIRVMANLHWKWRKRSSLCCSVFSNCNGIVTKKSKQQQKNGRYWRLGPSS